MGNKIFFNIPLCNYFASEIVLLKKKKKILLLQRKFRPTVQLLEISEQQKLSIAQE